MNLLLIFLIKNSFFQRKPNANPKIYSACKSENEVDLSMSYKSIQKVLVNRWELIIQKTLMGLENSVFCLIGEKV